MQGGQSRPQTAFVSLPVQTPSPQQTLNCCVVHAPQREASQPTGWTPPSTGSGDGSASPGQVATAPTLDAAEINVVWAPSAVLR